jgi:murein L,D-transpeptidase YafK
MMQKTKLFQYLVIGSCALLPWRATAINQDSFAQKSAIFHAGRDIVENLLVKSLMEITQGNTKQALNTVNELIRTAPNFKLAYLIRGDLLASQASALEAFGNPKLESGRKPAIEEIEGLREEARTRIAHYLSENQDHQIPKLMVQLEPSQQHVIIVDTSRSRLFVYKKSENGLAYVNDFYVTIGKNGVGKEASGDKRTPIGVYFASTKLNGPLADIYGDAAYPLSYPNELDAHQNRNGSGIWLHGTPTNTYSRPPHASDGCVVLSNPDLKSLTPILQNGNTPVIIADKLEWMEAESLDKQSEAKQSLLNSIEAWRADWAAQDTDHYLSHYSKNFFYSDGNLQQWANYKRGIQASKPKVNIKLEDVSLFSYPSVEHPLVVVNFVQDFRSPSLQNKMRKRQYWAYENNQWKIIYEGAG